VQTAVPNQRNAPGSMSPGRPVRKLADVLPTLAFEAFPSPELCQPSPQHRSLTGMKSTGAQRSGAIDEACGHPPCGHLTLERHQAGRGPSYLPAFGRGSPVGHTAWKEIQTPIAHDGIRDKGQEPKRPMLDDGSKSGAGQELALREGPWRRGSAPPMERGYRGCAGYAAQNSARRSADRRIWST
jgi:hypothetical protein